MNQKINVTVNGKTYEVEIGDLSVSPIEVTVQGKSYSVNLEAIDSITTPVIAPAKTSSTATPKITPTPAAVPVKSQPVPTAAAGTGADIRAPMPGIIRDITVKPGQKIEAGQQVCALEAMKMKNALRAEHAGTITSVEVTEGQRVAYGDIIVKFA